MAKCYSIEYIYCNFFIHSSVDGHQGCFHVLAIVSSLSVKNGILVSLSILVSSGYMTRSGISGSYGGFIPSFLGISIPSSIVTVSVYIPSKSARGFSFLYTLSSIVCRFFDSHSDLCEVLSHCSFDLHSSNKRWVSLDVFISHLYVFFGEMSV